MVREIYRPIRKTEKVKSSSEALLESIQSFNGHLRRGSTKDAVHEAVKFFAYEVDEYAGKAKQESKKLLKQTEKLLEDLKQNG